MRTIEQRLLDLERRVAGLEPQPSDDLGDILRSFPGGIGPLANASGYHRESLYQFLTGVKRKRFPFKFATAVARAFGHRRALGKRVTVERLRSSWEKQFQKAKGAQS
jgi:hypothetical protein